LEENLAPNDILIVSTHRPMQAIKLATRVIAMQQGEIIKDGQPENVLPQLVGQGVTRQTANPSNRQKRGALDVV